MEFDPQTPQWKYTQAGTIYTVTGCILYASCATYLKPCFEGAFVISPALSPWENPSEAGEGHMEGTQHSPITVELSPLTTATSNTHTIVVGPYYFSGRFDSRKE